MATSCFLQLILVLATCTAAAATNNSPMAAAPAPGPSSSAALSFLQASCALTLERAADCYNLLLPYADSFHGSLARVARTSGVLAAARQHDFTKQLARLKLRGTGAGNVADQTLDGCLDTISSDDTGANVTLGRLDRLVAGIKNKKEFESERSLAQDWLYSSGSEMLQCVDWIHFAGDAALASPVLKEVIAGCNTIAGYLGIASELTIAIKFESPAARIYV
ncbi:hypothetical protein EJB05_05522, partial [Eragrostis curvula]